jgi:alpha-glucosidase
VMNHTSAEHPWFRESRSSQSNPKRDWYFWRDGKGKRPPNNWKAIVGGSGWHYDGVTQQWYYASFLPFQPDLNYRNPDVRAAMFDVVRYWLDKGVDGFRLDIFHCIYKDAQFRSNPFALRFVPSEDLTEGFFQRWEYNLNRPENFELAQELRAVGDSYTPERVLLGELFGDDDTIEKYLGKQLDGLHLVFLWGLVRLKADARFFRSVIRHYETHYPAPYTPVYVFGNHDQKRLISKIGNDVRRAKLLALFQFTVRGVPVTYYGEEIGMAEGRFPARQAKDPLRQRYGWIPGFLVDRLDLYVNRDGCRTPMQWDDSANGGFCGADAVPWLPVHENYPATNVKRELAEEDSLLNVYRELLRLRRDSAAIRGGTIQLFEGPDISNNLLVYCRKQDAEVILVVINFGENPSVFQNPTACKRVLFAVGLDQPAGMDRITLPPDSGLILSN